MAEVPGFIYDLDALKGALPSIEANIEALEAGLKTQRDRLMQHHKLIAEGEAIIKLHKDGMK